MVPFALIIIFCIALIVVLEITIRGVFNKSCAGQKYSIFDHDRLYSHNQGLVSFTVKVTASKSGLMVIESKQVHRRKIK